MTAQTTADTTADMHRATDVLRGSKCDTTREGDRALGITAHTSPYAVLTRTFTTAHRVPLRGEPDAARSGVPRGSIGAQDSEDGGGASARVSDQELARMMRARAGIVPGSASCTGYESGLRLNSRTRQACKRPGEGANRYQKRAVTEPLVRSDSVTRDGLPISPATSSVGCSADFRPCAQDVGPGWLGPRATSEFVPATSSPRRSTMPAEASVAPVQPRSGSCQPSGRQAALRPGEYVQIRRSAGGKFAGRAGVVVAASGEQCVVRFGPAKGYPFALCDLVRVADAVRRA